MGLEEEFRIRAVSDMDEALSDVNFGPKSHLSRSFRATVSEK